MGVRKGVFQVYIYLGREGGDIKRIADFSAFWFILRLVLDCELER